MLEPAIKPEIPDFQLFFESAPDPCLLLNFELVIVAVNNAYLNTVRIPGDDILGKRLPSVLHELGEHADYIANLNRSLQWVRTSLKTDVMPAVKRVIHEPDKLNCKHRCYWRTTNTPVLRQGGTLEYIIHRLEYVSPDKGFEYRNDSQLALSEAQRHAKFGFWEWHLADNQHSWSEGMYRMLGLGESSEPISYLQIQQYFQPESWSDLFAQMEICRCQGTPYTCDAQLVRPDGGQIWVTISGLAVRDATGEIGELLTTVHDITERVSLKNALDAHIERYQAVVDSSVDGFLISDCDGRFVEANDAYARLSGYSREELLSMRISDVEAKMNQKEILEVMNKITKTGSRHFETTHRRKNGSNWPVEITASYWPSNGLHFAFIRDISKRKKLQLEIERRRNEMETLQRHQVAAQTAAAFAHELNQPLLAISSYCKASLMLLDLQTPDLNKVRKAVAASECQALRAGNAIRAMIDALTVQDIPAVVFGLSHEIRNVLEMAKTEYNLQFRFVLSVGKQLPPVKANRIHLQKVLLNLLYNCIEAAQQADVEVPEIAVSLDVKSESSAALVSIQDNGPGFSKEVQEHLFEPFFTTKREGIGLGLMISRALIELNGGQLWVDSRPGPGATFHLTLPFA